jgi:hypothetical protein
MDFPDNNRHNRIYKNKINWLQQLSSNEVHLVSSAQALRPQFITCTERGRSMVDVELQPRYHQSMPFGCAQCGGF